MNNKTADKKLNNLIQIIKNNLCSRNALQSPLINLLYFIDSYSDRLPCSILFSDLFEEEYQSMTLSVRGIYP